MPKLSFIVPVHDPNPQLFPRVLKALVTQSLKDYEAIFVIDGEWPDAVAEISRAFKKTMSHFKIVQIPHSGAQKARKEGFNHSTGEYIVFFDSDCVIEPHTAKAWVDVLDSNPSVDFVYSGYRFLNEAGYINSEPFDPWMLRVRNYISMCFPMRRVVYPGLNEDLESLQDWDMWLKIVAAGGVGKFLPGHAFSTALPTEKSISGKGCTNENWLKRMDKVKFLNNIPIKTVCVTSLNYRLDGIALAKAIDADYDDRPNDKPNHYKKIIQIGFSINPQDFDRAATAWGAQHEKVIFWTAEDVEAIYDTVSLRALEEYSLRINMLGKQYVEDVRAKEIMTKAGFKVEILPLPVISRGEIKPMPEQHKVLVDISSAYGHAFTAIEKAVPDIKFETALGVQKLADFTVMACFYKDRMLRPSVKRMIASGRHIISNIQAPFTGYMDDRISDGKFVKEFVERIRAVVKSPPRKEAINYYIDSRKLNRVLEAIK